MNFEEAVNYSHLNQFIIQNADDYLGASRDIENSFSGLLQALQFHAFFIESSIEIRNSIKLFQLGFINQAFYSLRNASELARVVTLFSAKDESRDTDLYMLWKTGGKFPFDSQVKKEIKAASGVYEEISTILEGMFESHSELLKKVQKYIHKQGANTFYFRGLASKEHELNRTNNIQKDYIDFLEGTLREVAVLRLCIDPFPVLLTDSSVQNKIHFEPMSYPYSESLLRIIGDKNLELYKNSLFYISHVDYFAQNQTLSDASITLIHENYYDKDSWQEIELEFNALPNVEQKVVRIFNVSDEISWIYTHGGFGSYFSKTKSNKKSVSMDSRFFNSNVSENSNYDGVYLTRLVIDEAEYFIEHNVKFNANQLVLLKSIK